MFNSKPFGTATAFGAGTFGNATTPFGQTNTAFGAKPATGNVFGGGSAFGTATPASGGLFGTTQTSGTGLFGQTSTAFGQPAATSVFGGTSTTNNLFGTTTPATQTSGLFGGSSTSAFGSPRPTFGGFGAPGTSTNLFGQGTSTSTSLFGGTSTAFGATPTGTTIKFNAPISSDTMMKGGVSQNISVRHQCITCMKEYETKSLEELRLEDYAANRKGPQAGVSAFGTTAPQSGGLFGAPAAASSSGFSFGTTQAKPLFGTTPGTSTFGATNTGLFGQTTQPQNTGLFGQKTVGFGTATTSTTPAFSFGSTNTSMFGQNNQQKPMFGQPTAGTGLFGQTATSQPTAFGTQNTFGFGAAPQQNTGLFGTKPTGFGSTATTTANTFSFGNTTTGGLFGQKAATPAFGTGTTGFGTGTGFGTFGAAQTTGTNLFGQNKPGATGFGTTGTGFGNTFGTGFGTTGGFGNLGMNTSTGTTGLFGQTAAAKNTGFGFTGSTNFGFGQPFTGQSYCFGTNPPATMTNDPNIANLMQQQLQTQQYLLCLANNPYGDNPLFRNILKDSKRQDEMLKPTNPAAQKAVLADNLYKVSPLPAAKAKPKPITPLIGGKVSLFDGLDDEEPCLSSITFMPKRSVKKLVIRQTTCTTTSSVVFTSSVASSTNFSNEINMSTSILVKNPPSSSGSASSLNEKSSVQGNAHGHGDQMSRYSPLTVNITERVHEGSIQQFSGDTGKSNEQNLSTLQEDDEESENDGESENGEDRSDAHRKNLNSKFNDTIEALHTKGAASIPERGFHLSHDSADTSRLGEKETLDSSIGSQLEDNQDESSTYEKPHPTGIKLKRDGYYTIPSLNELIPLIDGNGNCFIANFVVGREGYGTVMFLGMTNVANLDLDEIVSFEKKEIVIYPDDDNKPPIGEGLNRRAEITLEGVWPSDKTTRLPIKDPERLSAMGFIDKVERNTSRLGARFIHYKPSTGTWKFEVDHFSKYGLEDSDDDDDAGDIQQTKAKKILKAKKLQVANGQKTDPAINVMMNQMHTKKMKATAHGDDDDDEMQDADLMSAAEENFFSPLQQLVTANVDSERIQGMKASFFMDDIEDSWDMNEGDIHEPIPHFAALNSSEQYVKPVPIRKPTTNLSRSIYDKQVLSMFEEPRIQMMSTHLLEQEPPIFAPSFTLDRISETREHRFVSFAAPSTPPITASYFETPVSIRRPANLMGQKIGLKPLKKSLIFDKQHLIADIGYFKGRSFRVGWGLNGTLWHLGNVDGTTPGQKTAKDLSIFSSFSMPSPVNLQGYKLFTVTSSKVEVLANYPVDDLVKESVTQSLEVQLENSEVSFEQGVPVTVTKCGTGALHAHATLSEKQMYKFGGSHFDSPFLTQCNHVWELCVALWGKIRGLDPNEEVSPYVRQMARREALSDWLIRTTKEKVLSEINNTTFNSSDCLSTMFSYLTGRQISEAVSLAQESHDHGLATLLAQSEGNFVVRQQIMKQLSSWDSSGAYKLINNQRLKLYCLLAGCMVWKTPTTVINCCENLDWRRSFALHLWFSCYPTASITDAVAEFEKSFSDPSLCYSLPPYPPYMSDDVSVYYDNLFDTCFHLLKLYCDRSHPLDKLLAPETSTSAHLDYRLSWFLHEALDAIGYGHLPQNVAYNLHMNFAYELEAMGLWHWSVFIILHIPDANSRSKSIKNLLLRHLTIDYASEEKELFLQEKLLIPEEWIFEAKAIKAHSFGRYADEARYLLKSGRWNKSHGIIIEHLASEAIINENYEYLLTFLNELAPEERSSTIMNWASGGQVFLNYIHMSQMVDKVVKGKASAYDVEKIQPEIVSLCYKLSSLSCATAKDRLCQSEMAKKTATLLQAVFNLQAARAGSLPCTYQLAPHIKNLPMPEDYALQELRSLARNYLQDVASQ